VIGNSSRKSAPSRSNSGCGATDTVISTSPGDRARLPQPLALEPDLLTVA
jgi:hypothetical protein